MKAVGSEPSNWPSLLRRLIALSVARPPASRIPFEGAGPVGAADVSTNHGGYGIAFDMCALILEV